MITDVRNWRDSKKIYVNFVLGILFLGLNRIKISDKAKKVEIETMKHLSLFLFLFFEAEKMKRWSFDGDSYALLCLKQKKKEERRKVEPTWIVAFSLFLEHEDVLSTSKKFQPCDLFAIF